ncbi:MAG: type IV pilus biogenesis protein EbsA [Pseudanabaenaceae cyanobacterium]
MGLELREAPPQEVAMYAPYVRDVNRRAQLPYALGLYKTGELVGERLIEGGPSVPFVATWRVANTPLDFTLCKFIFDNQPELSYELQMVNNEFVSYLIDVINLYKEKQLIDFPTIFYSKLFRIELSKPE